MSNVYKHGTYSELGASVTKSAVQSGTVAVYVGIAPVNLVQGYADAGIINAPVKLVNFTNSQKRIGFTEDFQHFSLCEAVAAHFDNGMQNIGPIYVINVLDPDKHRETNPENVSLTFTNNTAEFKSNTVILDTIAIEGFVKDVDFKVDYDYQAEKVIISALNDKIIGTQTVAYYTVNLDAIDEDTVIGGVTASGKCSGLGALKFLYLKENQVCDILGMPGFSHIPKVYAKMINAATQVNGHWEAFTFADIPIVDADGEKIDTMAKARAWRDANGYNSERSEISYPKFKDLTTGRIFHGSTLNIVNSMITDYENDSVPFESCSNKEVWIGQQYFGEGSENDGFDEQEATADLNSYGISTCVFWGGKWVTWGGHTAKFQYGKDIDPRSYDSHYMRMLFFLMNGFQKRNADVIDKSFSRHKKDSILNNEQDIIDGYITKGALLEGSKIVFLAADNSVGDMVSGDFVYELPVSIPPRIKSLTGKIYYTDEGLASLVEEVE